MATTEATKLRYAEMAKTGLLVLLIVQSAHMVEHIAQVIQKFVLLMPTAHGLLGAIFDFELVHFLFNLAIWVPLVAVYVWYRRSGAPMPFALPAIVWFQGYHFLEHVVKMYQYYFLGVVVQPKGILGYIFPVIWLHFWLNLIVLFLIAGAYLGVSGARRRVTLATP
jgi:hypothetical protein